MWNLYQRRATIQIWLSIWNLGNRKTFEEWKSGNKLYPFIESGVIITSMGRRFQIFTTASEWSGWGDWWLDGCSRWFRDAWDIKIPSGLTKSVSIISSLRRLKVWNQKLSCGYFLHFFDDVNVSIAIWRPSLGVILEWSVNKCRVDWGGGFWRKPFKCSSHEHRHARGLSYCEVHLNHDTEVLCCHDLGE